MKFSKNLFKDNSAGTIIVCVLAIVGLYCLMTYLNNKGKSGLERMDNESSQTNVVRQNTVQPADSLGQNAAYASAKGIETSTPGLPSNCSQPNIQDPSDLLPKDFNSEWGQLNPSGKGDLSDVNLLNAGHHMGVVSQANKNANQQLRSDPVIPQQDTGPWNKSTVQHDFMRPAFEIGSGNY